MRGTARITNKALSAPVLLMGAERSLVILSSFFWGWALMGVIPHWPMVFVLSGFILNIYLLKFLAKRDAQSVAVFKANSRFLIQNRLYVSRGFVNTTHRVKRIQTVPVKLWSRV